MTAALIAGLVFLALLVGALVCHRLGVASGWRKGIADAAYQRREKERLIAEAEQHAKRSRRAESDRKRVETRRRNREARGAE